MKRVDPAEYEVITIASCTGHSFVYTREIPDGESEDIEYLTPRSYARLGSICHGTHISNAQSILRTRRGLWCEDRVGKAEYDTFLPIYQ